MIAINAVPNEVKMSHPSAILRILCACLLGTQLSAQSSTVTPPPQANLTADQLVEHLVANAEVYLATLPSLTAHETIASKTSEVFSFFGKNVVHAEATIRARKASNGVMEESRQIASVNGKLFAPDKSVGFPMSLSGGFGGFAAEFFTRQHRPCFAFVLTPDRLAYEPFELAISLSSDATAHPECDPGWEGFTGMARIDPATLQLLHLERSFPETAVTGKHRLTFCSVDLAPAKLGQKTFWLPTTLIGHAQNGKIRLDWASTYSDYHQFAASSTILPVSAP